MDHPIASFRKTRRLTLAQFGELVGVRKAAVCKWEGGKQPSAKKAAEIEVATNGEIPRSSLRPDLWPPSHAAAAE